MSGYPTNQELRQTSKPAHVSTTADSIREPIAQRCYDWIQLSVAMARTINRAMKAPIASAIVTQALMGIFEWNKVLSWNALEIHSRLLLKVSKPATN